MNEWKSLLSIESFAMLILYPANINGVSVFLSKIFLSICVYFCLLFVFSFFLLSSFSLITHWCINFYEEKSTALLKLCLTCPLWLLKMSYIWIANIWLSSFVYLALGKKHPYKMHLPFRQILNQELSKRVPYQAPNSILQQRLPPA